MSYNIQPERVVCDRNTTRNMNTHVRAVRVAPAVAAGPAGGEDAPRLAVLIAQPAIRGPLPLLLSLWCVR